MKNTNFNNTSEYAYLSALISLQDTLFNMMNNGDFTSDQVKKLIPTLDYSNEITNLPITEFNKTHDTLN
ncbi:hypothetical protein [Cytobacillus gottheilii]|uniref:hypothetical protein n=1 Tax=Cytobacillus gottheilii TaxID=859144 RepID=UPI0009B98C31|nr:hypothetical protein [Cytobacillus gottheilii]